MADVLKKNVTDDVMARVLRPNVHELRAQRLSVRHANRFTIAVFDTQPTPLAHAHAASAALPLPVGWIERTADTRMKFNMRAENAVTSCDTLAQLHLLNSPRRLLLSSTRKRALHLVPMCRAS